MAAVDLSGVATPANGVHIVRVAMEAVAGNVTQVTPPVWATRMTLQIKKADESTDDVGKIASSGTQGAAIGNDWIEIAAGALYTTAIAKVGNRAGGSFYITEATGSGFAHMSFELV
jgi:hypothetical protein